MMCTATLFQIIFAQLQLITCLVMFWLFGHITKEQQQALQCLTMDVRKQQYRRSEHL